MASMSVVMSARWLIPRQRGVVALQCLGDGGGGHERIPFGVDGSMLAGGLVDGESRRAGTGAERA